MNLLVSAFSKGLNRKRHCSSLAPDSLEAYALEQGLRKSGESGMQLIG